MTSERAGSGWSERIAQAMLTAYQRVLSPTIHAGVPGACRFQPTCSEYAAIAVAEHGWLRGTAMAAWRVLRCNPLNRPGGFDPVPAKNRVQVSGYGLQRTKAQDTAQRAQ